jgi:hypothetical protein
LLSLKRSSSKLCKITVLREDILLLDEEKKLIKAEDFYFFVAKRNISRADMVNFQKLSEIHHTLNEE